MFILKIILLIDWYVVLDHHCHMNFSLVVASGNYSYFIVGFLILVDFLILDCRF